MPNNEFEEWYARSLVIPTGWSKNELQTARIVSSNIKSVSVKECYNNYLEEIPEDDPELMKQAEALINKGKENGK